MLSTIPNSWYFGGGGLQELGKSSNFVVENKWL
jgi:hypothetical protein